MKHNNDNIIFLIFSYCYIYGANGNSSCCYGNTSQHLHTTQYHDGFGASEVQCKECWAEHLGTQFKHKILLLSR